MPKKHYDFSSIYQKYTTNKCVAHFQYFLFWNKYSKVFNMLYIKPIKPLCELKHSLYSLTEVEGISSRGNMHFLKPLPLYLKIKSRSRKYHFK